MAHTPTEQRDLIMRIEAGELGMSELTDDEREIWLAWCKRGDDDWYSAMQWLLNEAE